MERTIKIDDTLSERIANAKDELIDNFKEYLTDNPDLSDFDNYYQDKGADALHEIADSNTPVYTSEINDLYYLYGNDFDEAYQDAGIGNGDEENHRQVTIYCFIESKLNDYLREIEDAFNRLKTEGKDGAAIVEEIQMEIIKANVPY